MPKVYAPNKNYNGISASVPFTNGVGECSDPYILSWFRDKGYQVEEEEKQKTKPPSKKTTE